VQFLFVVFKRLWCWFYKKNCPLLFWSCCWSYC